MDLSILWIQPSMRIFQRCNVRIVRMPLWVSIGFSMVVRIIDIWTIFMCAKHSQIGLICTFLYLFLLCQSFQPPLCICFLAEGYFILGYMFDSSDILLSLFCTLLFVYWKVIQLFCWSLTSYTLMKGLARRLVLLTNIALLRVGPGCFLSQSKDRLLLRSILSILILYFKLSLKMTGLNDLIRFCLGTTPSVFFHHRGIKFDWCNFNLITLIIIDCFFNVLLISINNTCIASGPLLLQGRLFSL